MNAVVEVGTLIILIGSALGVLAKWVFRPVFVAVRATYRAVMFIQYELQENSGKSMRDIAIRTEQRFEMLFDHLGIHMPDHLRSPHHSRSLDKENHS